MSSVLWIRCVYIYTCRTHTEEQIKSKFSSSSNNSNNKKTTEKAVIKWTRIRNGLWHGHIYSWSNSIILRLWCLSISSNVCKLSGSNSSNQFVNDDCVDNTTLMKFVVNYNFMLFSQSYCDYAQFGISFEFCSFEISARSFFLFVNDLLMKYEICSFRHRNTQFFSEQKWFQFLFSKQKKRAKKNWDDLKLHTSEISWHQRLSENRLGNC